MHARAQRSSRLAESLSDSWDGQQPTIGVGQPEAGLNFPTTVAASDDEGMADPATRDWSVHVAPHPRPSSSLLKTAMNTLCCSHDEEPELGDGGKSGVTVHQSSANFHQAAAVYLLGGSSAIYDGVVPENASRCTNDEMRTHWEAAEGKIGKNERLVCHFAPLDCAGMILGVDSIGFRASTAGQGGGGVFVSAVGPHELEWDQYQGGNFRARAGRELWGEKADDVLIGGCAENKLDVAFLIKVHVSQFNASIKVPGRDVIRVIPPDVLTEQHGYHWLPKKQIAKAFILKQGVSSIDIAGLEMRDEAASVKVKTAFGVGIVLLVLLQLVAVSAILLDTMYPVCSVDEDCDSRYGSYCDSIGSGRCMFCGDVRWYGLAVFNTSTPRAFQDVDCSCPDALSWTKCDNNCFNGNQGVFCDTNKDCHCGTDHCGKLDREVRNNCTVPAKITSTGQSCVNDTGFTNSFAKDTGRIVPTVPWKDFCEDKSNFRNEFCAEHEAFIYQVYPHVDSNTNNIVRLNSSCPHPACAGCEREGGWGYDGRRSRTRATLLARNLKDPDLRNFAVFCAANLMVVLPVVNLMTSIRATAASVSQFGDEGQEPQMALLLVVSALRHIVIMPALVMIVPFDALYSGFQSGKMVLHAMVALFTLKLDSELFQCLLPESMRQDVERFGRVQVSETKEKLNDTIERIAVPVFCVTTVGPILYYGRLHFESDSLASEYETDTELYGYLFSIERWIQWGLVCTSITVFLAATWAGDEPAARRSSLVTTLLRASRDVTTEPTTLLRAGRDATIWVRLIMCGLNVAAFVALGGGVVVVFALMKEPLSHRNTLTIEMPYPTTEMPFLTIEQTRVETFYLLGPAGLVVCAVIWTLSITWEHRRMGLENAD
eukprot:COSAG06_NODE_781_length_12364_cov_6.388912_9_plen_883_part_00